MHLPLGRTIFALLYIVRFCRCFFPISGGESRGIHRQGIYPSEGEKQMRSLLRKGNITHLCNKIRCANHVQRYEGRRGIFSSTGSSGKRNPLSSRLFSSFETKTPGSQVEQVVDGIAVTIYDNTNIFKEEISNTPIVLIHGCYGSKNNFRVFSKSLKSNKIVTLDLRNHGNSKHTDSMKYEEMESDIKKVLDELHIRKCCLVGFSLGGKVSMYCALKNQSLFSHLVVMDILPFDYNEKKYHVKLPYNISHMTKILFNIKTKLRPRNKAQFLAHLRAQVPDISSSFEQFICTSLKEERAKVGKATGEVDMPIGGTDLIRDSSMGTEGAIRYSENPATEQKNLVWKINVDTIFRELPHILSFPLNHQEHKYHNPCSFIIGTKSDLVYTMPQYESIIENYFPSSQKFILPDATHTVYIDNAKECADIVNRTLRL
ncbi:alpha/beta hydrolase, putative [Plasmodium knowlesi strain H]|uniref:Alpha/beta hydrolase, putative n=3 Tax=Plasmodium knowlesi TaxID=5850 RepID=A0A5K1VHD2_PLAKH|nr:alpha/beta hydrolase, putative [Plasmodium knowlesi strain H]OTN65223.1 putative Alpha/beta hydrolase [Plasmodium knowlesi]CAA9988452.1 alpha/beta hydrolase, putative [Plasmodium knowlesi strain H]SBO19826.1 alpha/beta hydrolase, putative [Plasmodium knowlesi strain H]SBO20447.1 alpha/beta hydrolase, putative [Plasmodium knowlesi strain H]VVS77926.1 alpha/beta hydrolase, putative [Plasmodium knowlesi strain H]|eukprot:XP_002259433.1 hypothetical protein, conserved in Plasmodium species [Plasmodium knowlesi strain H]